MDFALHELDGSRRPAQTLDLFEIGAGSVFDFVGQGFHVVTAGEGIHRVGDSRFVGQNLLRANGELGSPLAREGQGFIESVRVQRLGPPERSGQSLDGYAYHVVERLLSGQRRSARLRVKAQLA